MSLRDWWESYSIAYVSSVDMENLNWISIVGYARISSTQTSCISVRLEPKKARQGARKSIRSITPDCMLLMPLII